MSVDMEKLVALCKRKGFIFQSSEIYGGINGFWDYGPLGVELKKNIKDAWWYDMVRNPPPGPDGEEISMVGLDCAIIMNPKVWEASGHVAGFQDPMVSCDKCKKLFRADKVHFMGASIDHAPPLVISCEADSRTDAESVLNELAARYQKKKNPLGMLQLASVKQFFDAVEIPEGWPRPCPNDGCDGKLSLPRAFNLMNETNIGALVDTSTKAYLRPETAQGIFVNFKNVLDSNRLKLPFGIAQIGKAFRNEVTPRNYTFRSREFEQMEIEFFCHPDESMKWYTYWRDVRKAWYSKLGINSERLKPREQTEKERAFYSIGTTDIEYMFPFSEEPQELEGVAHRAAYDLTQHQQHSGKDMSYFDEELWARADKSAYGGDKKKEQEAKRGLPFRFTPHVIEPSAGADRFTLAVLCEAYHEDTAPDEDGKPQSRVVMRFHPRLAPVKAAIFPLEKKGEMAVKARALYRELKMDFAVEYDDGGSIGRRYRRQDEIGTPWCITIDGQTLQDETVTIRDRDTLQQERIRMSDVAAEMRRRLRA